MMEEGFSFGTHLLFTSINFFLLIFAILILGRKKIVEGIKRRGLEIKNEFSSLKAEREEVERLKTEYLEKLKGVDSEIENMKKKAIEEIEKSASVMRKKIMESSKRFEESIDRLIKAEYEKVISSFEKEVIDMAVEIAKRIVMEKLGKAEEKRLFDEAISFIKK
jgi:F0F1-type ATP synthase membrane subunit b/b'